MDGALLNVASVRVRARKADELGHEYEGWDTAEDLQKKNDGAAEAWLIGSLL